jgi:hypothetical protein
MSKARVPVNLADPKDIQAKMPEIKRLLANASQELDAIKAQVEMLTRIVGDAPATASASTPKGRKRRSRTRKAAPSQERAISALVAAGKPMGPASLFRWMESQGLERPSTVAALGSILWAAEKGGRIGKTTNGLYVPPGFPIDRPLTDYDEAARKGMPAPAGGNGYAAATNNPTSPNGSPPAGEDRELRLEDSREGPG